MTLCIPKMPAFLGVLRVAAMGMLAAGGCSYNFGSRGERVSGIEADFRKSERDARASRTLSHLKAIEAALSDYVKAEGGRIPPKLDLLIPKYLAEIPTVDLDLSGHRETAKVEYYPSGVIRAGAVDGSQLRDTGKWGYVFNDRQVIVFVDCTHVNSRGKPWYLERGVF